MHFTVNKWVHFSCLLIWELTLNVYATTKSLSNTEFDFSQCGKFRTSSPKVMNGKTVTLGDWPWVVALGYHDSVTFEFKIVCSGSLIARNWIITVAHCPFDEIAAARFSDLDFSDYVEDGANPIDIPVEEMVPHPDFSVVTNTNDIALIRLKIAVKYTQSIRPICLPQSAEYKTDSFYTNKTLAAVGWGYTDFDTKATLLREIKVDTTSISECASKYARSLATTLDENIICEMKSKGHFCGDNSGAPLMTLRNGVFILLGIVSHRDFCTSNDLPGIYTKIAQYIEWISNTIKVVGTTCVNFDKRPGICTEYSSCPNFAHSITSLGTRRAAVSAIIDKNLCHNNMNQIIICCPDTNVEDEKSYLSLSSRYMTTATNIIKDEKSYSRFASTATPSTAESATTREAIRTFPVTTPELVELHWVTKPADEYFAEGADAAIKCEAEGVPRPQIMWNKATVETPELDENSQWDSNVRVVDGTLIIANIQRNNAGLYICRAVNGLESELSTTININVEVPPRWLREPKDETFTEGSNAEIECSADGVPSPKVVWKTDAEFAGEYKTLENMDDYKTEGNKLIIKNIRRKHIGSYMCDVSNGVGSNISATININVQVPPYWTLKPTDKIFIQGNTARIECKANGNPQPKVIWNKITELPLQDLDSKNNLEIKTKDGILILEDIQKSDEGYYLCGAANGIGPGITTNIKIGVQVPLHWITEPADKVFVEGSNGSVECKAEGMPQPQITWKKASDKSLNEYKILKNETNVVISGGVLTFQNIQTINKGHYLCEAVNGIGSSLSSIISVNVQGLNCSSCATTEKQPGICTSLTKCPFFDELITLHKSRRAAISVVISKYLCYNSPQGVIMCCPGLSCSTEDKSVSSTMRPPKITRTKGKGEDHCTNDTDKFDEKCSAKKTSSLQPEQPKKESTKKKTPSQENKPNMSSRVHISNYRFEWTQFESCVREKQGTNEYQLNVNLSKNKDGLSVLTGNWTLQIPFDDSITFKVNFEVFASNKFPSKFELPIPKACSNMRTFVQTGWRLYLRSHNLTTACPIPAGVHVISEPFEMDNFLRHDNVPSLILPGSYKATTLVTKNKVLIGCFHFAMDAIPRRHDNLLGRRITNNENPGAVVRILIIIVTCYVSTSSSKSCSLEETENTQYLQECEEEDEETALTSKKELISSGIIPNYCAVYIKCRKGYALESNNQSSSICYRGNWTPPLPQCKKICRKLETTYLNAQIKCYKDGKDINCLQTLVSGTIVRQTCNTYYHPEYPIDFSEIECDESGDWNHNLYPCLPDCGKQYSKLEPQIVDGVEEEFGNAPWHVGIYNKTKNNLICGGTIISTRVIISAAHCFFNTRTSILYNAKYFEIAVAKVTRDHDTVDNAIQKFYKVKEIRIPDHYRGSETNFASDIAVLITYENIQLSNVVLPSCLEPPRNTIDLRNGVLGKVSGWGQDASEIPSRVLLTTSLPYMKYTKCLTKFQQEDRQSITADKFCAGNDTGSRVSRGDSGGGFLFLHPHYKLHYLRGVVSVKLFKATSITIFTDITNYLDWIQSILKEIKNEESGLSIIGSSCTTVDFDVGVCKRYETCPYFNQFIQSNANTPSSTFTSVLNKHLCDSQKNRLIICCPRSRHEDEDGVAITSYSQCGKSNRTPIVIFYTQVANAGNWPWTVIFVSYNDRMDDSILCVGSLISARWVITSAECVLRMKNQSVYAHLGDGYHGDRSDKIIPIDILIDKTTIHPGFVRSEYLNNIALARLSSPVNLTEFIRPICIPNDVEYKKMESYLNRDVYSFDYLSHTDVYARMTNILSVDECSEKTNMSNPYIPETEFCVDHCHGLDGSPLLVLLSSINTYYLVGIRSYNYGVCDDGGPPVSVYTNTIGYQSWIQKHTRNS